MSQTNLVSLFNCVIRNEKFSHCRLCLKIILDEYVRLDQHLFVDNTDRQVLSKVLEEIVGEVFDEVPGLEAVCTDCVEAALLSIQFINVCRRSNNTITTLFQNIARSLDINTDIDENKMLYLVLNGQESKVVIEEKKNESHHNSEQYFECTDCDETLLTISDLQNHNLSKHSLWTCRTCYKMFSTEDELMNHESVSHKDQSLNCKDKTCEERLQKHCRKELPEDHGTCEDKLKTKSTCPKCGKSYTTRDFYLRHVELCLNDMLDPHPIRGNMEKAFVCKKCGKAYSTQGGLRVHHRFVHDKATPHVCKECGKEFTAPSYLKIHMVTHTGERKFICNICNNKFVSKEALLYHTRRHTGEKPYSCKICNEKFVNASARAEHIKFKHVGPRYMCEMCSRKFVTGHFLKQHMSRHHDPTSKLYYGRNNVPSNLPVEQNMRKFVINAKTS